MPKYSATQIRDGIFALNTRRFGTVAELLIKTLANASWGKNISHDLYDENQLQRIEVKFSRALKSSDETIGESNILEQIISADDRARMFKSSEWRKFQFDCNIQQIKKPEFDILFYGIFFEDKVMIFKINSIEIDEAIQYSNKQHKGNEGEGQFHLNNRTYEYHLNNHFEKELTYQEILTMLAKIQKVEDKRGGCVNFFILLSLF